MQNNILLNSAILYIFQLILLFYAKYVEFILVFGSFALFLTNE